MSENNVPEFLKKLNSIKDKNFDVTLPTRKGAISLSPLNLKQQKNIISSIADGVAGMVSFTRILNEVVAEASNNDTLKIYERAPIIVALRINALGAEYKHDNAILDLNKLEDQLCKYKNIKDTTTIDFNDITIDLCVPTLEKENFIIKKLEEEIKRNGEDNNTKNLGSIYVYEIIKYINSIKFDDTNIDYSSLNIKNRVDIIEQLPLRLNKQIIEFIEQFRSIEREYLTINDVLVEINPGFFDTE